VALFAGYLRGVTDTVLSRIMDVIWAFPVVILGVALGTALSIGGLALGPIKIQSGSLAIPILIIGFVYVVYMARPLRGQVLSLREKEFIGASRSLGASNARIIFKEILPNLVAPIIVYATLIIPQNILFEAALSFLGAGIQPPTASWGAMLADATSIFNTAWWYMLFPGAALLITVLAFNLVGDGLQDALHPKAANN
jgi:peptide/nickel transport system permease protein